MDFHELEGSLLLKCLQLLPVTIPMGGDLLYSLGGGSALEVETVTRN